MSIKDFFLGEEVPSKASCRSAALQLEPRECEGDKGGEAVGDADDDDDESDDDEDDVNGIGIGLVSVLEDE